MKQNIYDDPMFFNGYRQLRESETGLNAALEEPAIESLLPDLSGTHVLDLGSGFGDFCRQARTRGAQHVTGVELSEKMLNEAKNQTHDHGITYVHCAIEDFPFEPNVYNLVVSRMALHYIRDFHRVVDGVFSALKAGGSFIFSVEHPICTALCEGWFKNDCDEELFWPVDNYQVEGPRKHDWFVNGVIKYHRTIETYLNTLLDCGFHLSRVLEPQVHPDHLAQRPDLRSAERRPPLLAVKGEKAPNAES